MLLKNILNASSLSSTPTISAKVIIFDWDDTICPSSFVDQWKVDNFVELPLVLQNLLQILGNCAKKCLEKASKFGEVIIITNSDDGWVKFSAEKFIPNLLPILPNYRIVSARTKYERFYPGQPLCWKAAAFAHEVHESFKSKDIKTQAMLDMQGEDEVENYEQIHNLYNSSVPTEKSSFGVIPSRRKASEYCDNRPEKSGSLSRTSDMRYEIISFGDSMEERTAVKIVAGQLSSVPKSIMFITSPTPIQIIGQLTMLTKNMKYICDDSESIDLEISAGQAEKYGEGVIRRKRIGVERKQSTVQSVHSRRRIRS